MYNNLSNQCTQSNVLSLINPPQMQSQTGCKRKDYEMRRLSQVYITKFVKDLGLELKRVRELKQLSIEEAAAMAELRNPDMVTRIEKGKKKLLFKALRLVIAYQQKINISLEDKIDD